MKRSVWTQLWRCRSREGAVALAFLLVFGAAQAATVRPWAFGERVLSVAQVETGSRSVTPPLHPRHARVPSQLETGEAPRPTPRHRRPVEGRPAPRAPDHAA